MERCKNVFEAILKYGHDEDWLPEPQSKFDSTDAPAGSPEKIEILRKRLELGLLVRTGGGLLEILQLQPAGKRSMAAAEFLRGYAGGRFASK